MYRNDIGMLGGEGEVAATFWRWLMIFYHEGGIEDVYGGIGKIYLFSRLIILLLFHEKNAHV